MCPNLLANVRDAPVKRRGQKRRPSSPPSRRSAAPARRPATANKRVDPKGKKAARAPADPEERRVRNRTLLFLGVLALVNAYVFLWRSGTGLDDLGDLPAAAIGSGGGGVLAPIADPPDSSCGGDPVRIFEGLEDLIPLETALAGGATLRLALLDRGIAAEEIDLVEAAIRAHVDLSLLGGSGAPVRMRIDRFGGVRALEVELAEGHPLQACRDATGFSVRNIQHPLRADVEVVALELGSDADLASAVQRAEEKPELARHVADVLAYDVDFNTEARPGDRIALIVEKRWLGRSFHRYGSILGVRFIGAAARVAYYLYKPEGGSAAFFDGKGRPMRRELLRSPVAFVPVPAEARPMLTPTLEVARGRTGAAYRVPEGAPVLAVATGIVHETGRDPSRGVYVDLELSDGRVARYDHLMRPIGELEPGTKVMQGEVLGLAGHSGRTPHDRLRFELVAADGEPADPMLLTAKGATRPARMGDDIPEAQRDRYEDDVAARRRALRVALR
jgi:murein DD-endopeptidase MepM/ murein hydrolase activator NlpD